MLARNVIEQGEIDIDDYPSWLGNDLINDLLPWEKGLQKEITEIKHHERNETVYVETSIFGYLTT